jgi:signal transduction histidine kinase
MQDSARSAVVQFLRHNRDRVLEEWEGAAGKLPTAAQLDLGGLRDHVPGLLDSLVEAMSSGNPPESADTLPDEHARTRLDQGFSLEEVAREYHLLRSALFRVMASRAAPLDPGALLELNEGIDYALMRALRRYHVSRSRTLEALDRISQDAFASHGESLRELLYRLLARMPETIEAADVGIIYLRDWDRLVVRAAVGLELTEGQLALPTGESLAGLVASSRRPCFTDDAAHDPRVHNEALVRAGVKALYAVPLLYGDDLIGVAKMGSRTASTFGDDDRQLFRDMAQRASVVIAHHRWAEEREVLLGVIGHDLRSPLGTITMGAAHLGRREPLSETGRRVLQRVTSAAWRMEGIIAGLTDYAKARFGGGLPVDRQVMDLGEAVPQLAGELATHHPDRELRFDVKGDAVGEWDRGRIGQIVANLVDNAVRYGAPQSPIQITVDGSQGTDVVLAVHNTGPAIPAALLPHLFEAFKRGKTQQGPGMGLGLYIVQHVAHAHGGTVSVDSTDERGTTFSVRLPRWGAGSGR